MGFGVPLFAISGILVAFCLLVIIFTSLRLRQLYIDQKRRLRDLQAYKKQLEPRKKIDCVDSNKGSAVTFADQLETIHGCSTDDEESQTPNKPPRKYKNTTDAEPAALKDNALYETPPQTRTNPYSEILNSAPSVRPSSNPPSYNTAALNYEPTYTEPAPFFARYRSSPGATAGSSPLVIAAHPKNTSDVLVDVRDGQGSSESDSQSSIENTITESIRGMVDIEKTASLAAPEEDTIVYVATDSTVVRKPFSGTLEKNALPLEEKKEYGATKVPEPFNS